jgi:hypothetical protein
MASEVLAQLRPNQQLDRIVKLPMATPNSRRLQGSIENVNLVLLVIMPPLLPGSIEP